jgi:prepilin-type N-terminal cleavage/methylation domain-containing protein
MAKQQPTTFISRLRVKDGVTLIEVVLSIVIVALLALMVLTADSAAFAIFRRGAATSANAEQAYTELEQTIAGGSGGSAATLSFRTGAVTYSVSGKYYTETSSGDEPNLTMTAFVPD